MPSQLALYVRWRKLEQDLPQKPANSYLKPAGVKLHQNGDCGGDTNGQQAPKLSCTSVVCVISVSQPPMCTCCWWGSLWISLMAFRVLIAGFCMEPGNESLDVVPVPNESAHCFPETQGRVKLCRQLLEFIFIYSFVCICLCDELFVQLSHFRRNTHNLYRLVDLVNPFVVCLLLQTVCVFGVCIVFKRKQEILSSL